MKRAGVEIYTNAKNKIQIVEKELGLVRDLQDLVKNGKIRGAIGKRMSN